MDRFSESRSGRMTLLATMLTCGMIAECAAADVEARSGGHQASSKQPASNAVPASARPSGLGPMRYYGGPKAPMWRAFEWTLLHAVRSDGISQGECTETAPTITIRAWVPPIWRSRGRMRLHWTAAQSWVLRRTGFGAHRFGRYDRSLLSALEAAVTAW